MLVTGNTALNLDVSTKLSNALPLFLLVIVGLSLILLTIVFRSLLVPLKATLGFLLSIVAQRGACRSGARLADEQARALLIRPPLPRPRSGPRSPVQTVAGLLRALLR